MPLPIHAIQGNEPRSTKPWFEQLFDSDFQLYAGAWLAVFVVAALANVLAKRVIVRGVRAIVSRTRVTWDDVLVEHHVFEKLSHLAPALVVYLAAPIALQLDSEARSVEYIRRLANVWMIVAGARAVGAFVDAIVTLGLRSTAARDKPLRSYAQVVQLILWLAAGILSVATLMDKSPWALLTGLGAMTAILLLVFRDSILGFVASIRIASADLLRTGDWVEMPAYGADGDVIEIGLHSVKIQNWDKTITTIPTHAFMSDSFKNWRGMTQSGGRRIKRAIALDQSSVRFLEDADFERLGRIQLLRSYLKDRTAEVESWNSKRKVDTGVRVNGRRLTNLGTFRAYVEAYVRSLEPIREDMTFLVRQLPPGPEGVAIEIYCFSGEQRWVQYEGIMGDIFDHLLAAVPEFDLRVYQRPSGQDLRGLLAAAAPN